MQSSLSWGYLPGCALALLAGGCAGPRADEAAGPARQWQLLCDRLRCDRPITTPAPAQHDLTAHELDALKRVGRSAVDSVVWIETVIGDSSVASEQTAAAGGAETMVSHGLNPGGTGVVISGDGLILTNAHVVRSASAVTVVLPDGSRHRVKRVLAAAGLDVAVLVVDRAGLKPLPLTGSSPRFGEPVVAVGGRRFDEPTGLRAGTVTNAAASLQNNLDPTRRRDYSRLIESTVPLEPGFSGGPLLDADGRLVGLNVAMTGRPGQPYCRGYAIPFDNVARQAIQTLARQAREVDHGVSARVSASACYRTGSGHECRCDSCLPIVQTPHP